jgi:hypothetical protein
MKVHRWESEDLYTISKELQQLLDDEIVKTVISMSLTTGQDNYNKAYYSAILIYK